MNPKENIPVLTKEQQSKCKKKRTHEPFWRCTEINGQRIWASWLTVPTCQARPSPCSCSTCSPCSGLSSRATLITISRAMTCWPVRRPMLGRIRSSSSGYSLKCSLILSEKLLLMIYYSVYIISLCSKITHCFMRDEAHLYHIFVFELFWRGCRLGWWFSEGY